MNHKSTQLTNNWLTRIIDLNCRFTILDEKRGEEDIFDGLRIAFGVDKEFEEVNSCYTSDFFKGFCHVHHKFSCLFLLLNVAMLNLKVIAVSNYTGWRNKTYAPLVVEPCLQHPFSHV